jgi:hypothetical protein
MQGWKSDRSELGPRCYGKVWVNDAMLDANWSGLAQRIREGDEEQCDKRRKVHSARQCVRARCVTRRAGVSGGHVPHSLEIDFKFDH